MNASASPSAAIRFYKVSKRYGRQQVFENLTFAVEHGEFFGLVGVNGAGKTTCMKGLLDFCDIDAGAIRIFDVPHRRPCSRIRLAYLPERFLPPYYLTGRDFLKYMARLHGIGYKESVTFAILEGLGLDSSVLSKPVREYSKGMAQKLGLAACFLSRRELFVLDEPMSGLDPLARIQATRHLLHLKSTGHTVFFSTHMLTDVDALCDRLGILHDGALRFVGTPRACRETFGGNTLEHAFVNCISGAGPASR